MLNRYKQDAKLLLRHTWFITQVSRRICFVTSTNLIFNFIQVFVVAQIIVSITVATENSKIISTGGYQSGSFAAIWSMFMVIGFSLVSGRIILFGGRQPEMMIGFLIAFAFMLSELLFVLAVAFYILGAEATNQGYCKFLSIHFSIFFC